MTGVEILAMNEVVVAYEFNLYIYFGVITVIALLFVLISVINCRYVGIEDIVVGAIVGIVFGAIFGIFPANNITPSEYEIQYKVIISDEVSMNDFLERYEIISQEGKIYKVRERDGDTK